MSVAGRARAAILAPLVAGALTAVGCTDDEPDVSRATPAGTPAAEPAPTPTPRVPATPTPAAVPTGPDDDGWAEHLGLTAEELAQRRASDDFLEWAEPRRARTSLGASHIFERVAWRPANDDTRVHFINPEEIWPSFAPQFRDHLLARGRPPSETPPGRDATHGYLHAVSRQNDAEMQRFVLVGFYEADGQINGLVGQVAVRLTIDRDHELLAEGQVEATRQPPLQIALHDEPWSTVYRNDILPDVRDWAQQHGGH